MARILWGQSIPALSPDVDRHLLDCLSKEVTLYSVNVVGNKCLLCPFRSFGRAAGLKRHLKYHCEKNMYLADIQSPQLGVVRAYYDYCRAISPFLRTHVKHYDLLKISASMIADWNNGCSSATMDLLRSQNRPVLVRVLTSTGPELWAQELTLGCIRHSREVYITPSFADIFLSILITNEGKVKKSVSALYYHFGTSSKTLGLMPSNHNFWKNLLYDISNHVVVSSKIK